MRLLPLAALLILAACAGTSKSPNPPSASAPPSAPNATRDETPTPVDLTAAASTFVKLCYGAHTNPGATFTAVERAGFTVRYRQGLRGHTSKAMVLKPGARDCVLFFGSDATQSEFRAMMANTFKAKRTPDAELPPLPAGASEAERYVGTVDFGDQEQGMFIGARVVGVDPNFNYALIVVYPD